MFIATFVGSTLLSLPFFCFEDSAVSFLHFFFSFFEYRAKMKFAFFKYSINAVNSFCTNMMETRHFDIVLIQITQIKHTLINFLIE